MKIISFSNPKIKEIVKLREHRARVKSGLTLVEGAREVTVALNAGVVIKQAYICSALLSAGARKKAGQELVDHLTAKKVLVTEVSPDVFAKISYGERRDGVVAVAQPAVARLSALKTGQNPFFIVIERVEKPGNLGAILRTCDAVGVDGLLICDPATDIYNPNVIRASLGTVFSVPVVSASSQDVLAFLQKRKIRIVATSPLAQKNYVQVDMRGPTAIVVGSESEGLSEFWLKHADEKVLIPMKGQADSLNASVTAAIVAYEVVRQRAAR